MLIYAFANLYPSEYKPYYDAQFASLLEAGHEVRIFALDSGAGGLTKRVLRYHLHERTTQVLGDGGRQLLRRSAGIVVSVLRNPVGRLQASVRVGRARHPTPKATAKAILRACTLPLAPPDAMIVHGHRTMIAFDWLPALWPSVPLGLFYYGGDPADAGQVEQEQMERALRTPGAIITLSRYARGELARWGVPEEAVAVLPLCFALDDFRPPEPRTYHRSGETHLVLAGRLSEGKGHPYALEAMSALKAEGLESVRLSIVGGGPLKREIETQVSRLGLGAQVELLGAVDNPTLIRLFGEADAVLLPSHSTPTWTETQGTVIQEAMLMEAVAITTATGGVPDSIPEIMKPYQVPPRDSGALADAIRRVCRLPETELARLGEECRAWVMQNFDVVRFNERLLELVIASGQPAAGRIT